MCITTVTFGRILILLWPLLLLQLLLRLFLLLLSDFVLALALAAALALARAIAVAPAFAPVRDPPLACALVVDPLVLLLLPLHPRSLGLRVFITDDVQFASRAWLC